MNHCNITEFQQVLRNASIMLRSLSDIIVDVESFTRTKHFAECSSEHRGTPITIYAPTTPRAMELALHAARVMKGVEAELSNMQILNDELLCPGFPPHYCDIVVETRPSGCLLSEAVYTMTYAHLRMGLREFRNRMRHLNLSHNNLHFDNITIDNEYRWHPMRCYYMTEGYGGDEDSFARIEALIERYAMRDMVPLVCEELSTYSTNPGTPSYPIVERRQRFATHSGVGFKDEEGNIVIEAKYADASDFDEGRATVTTHEGKMGLINIIGTEIIAAIYDNISYNSDNGNSIVRLNDKCATFSYVGEQLSEWK